MPLLIAPNPDDPALSETVLGIDESGAAVETRVVVERALTLFLNSREVVTVMTIGDHPELLALGYLRNQAMLGDDEVVTGIDVDDELGVVVVRTLAETDYEEKLAKRVRTSGCAQGTVFADVMAGFGRADLSPGARLRAADLTQLLKAVNTAPSLYLAAGAIHGCVLAMGPEPLVYMEDVGRHNAVDKIAGWMWRERVDPADKLFYTTGRLTSEMVIKIVMMGIPILVSRSGFTASGVALARQAGLTLVGRARGRRFVALSGAERIVFDAAEGAEEDRRHARKSAVYADEAR